MYSLIEGFNISTILYILSVHISQTALNCLFSKILLYFYKYILVSHPPRPDYSNVLPNRRLQHIYNYICAYFANCTKLFIFENFTLFLQIYFSFCPPDYSNVLLNRRLQHMYLQHIILYLCIVRKLHYWGLRHVYGVYRGPIHICKCYKCYIIRGLKHISI
jgi:hypothetical protein